MNNYKIISDSPCDLPKSLLEENDIDIISLYVSFDNNNYIKEYDNIKVEEIYSFMKEKPDAPIKTSLPSYQDYIDKFTTYLENDIDILCICMNSNFSGSYQSAVNAAKVLEKIFPNRKIKVFDSCQITGVHGSLVLEASSLKKNNYSLEDNIKELEKIKNTGNLIFTIDDLKYLQIGGRIGKVQSMAGTLLNIKPIIIYKDAELNLINKVRGRKKSIEYIINTFLEKYKDNVDDYNVVIVQSSCIDDGKYIYDILTKNYNIKNIKIFNVGTIISIHIGPTAIGIGILKKVKKRL